MKTVLPPQLIPTFKDWEMEVKFQNFLFHHRKNVKNQFNRELNKLKS